MLLNGRHVPLLKDFASRFVRGEHPDEPKAVGLGCFEIVMQLAVGRKLLGTSALILSFIMPQDDSIFHYVLKYFALRWSKARQ